MTDFPFPPENQFLKYIWNRVHRYHKSWMQVIVGDVGEGKSYAALCMAERLDKRFNIDKVCFTPKEFMKAVDSIKYKGEAIVFDEAGLLMSSRKWFTMTNIMCNEILQTFRYKNPIVIFVLPDFSYLDSQARKIVQCLGVVKRRGNDPSRMRLHMLKHDRREGKSFFPHPIVRRKKLAVKIKSLIFSKFPSEKLLEEYEEKAGKYKGRLQQKNWQLLEAMEQESVAETRTIQDDIKYVQDNPEKFTNRLGRIDRNIIRTLLGVSVDKAKQIKAIIDKEAMKYKKDT